MRRIIMVLALVGAAVALPVVALAAQPPDLHCPSGGEKLGESGTYTEGDTTISWAQTTVIISGPGEVTFCVKGGKSGNSGIVTLGAGTYDTGDLGLVGPKGQSQDISYMVVYDVENPPNETGPTGPTGETGTTGPTGDTGPSPTVSPSTSPSPPDDDTTKTKKPPRVLAFTGSEDWIIPALFGVGLLAIAGIALYLRGRHLGKV